MKDTRIIKGRANSLMGSYEFLEGTEAPPQGNPWKPAVLVIGERTVFTEDQVRDMLDRIWELEKALTCLLVDIGSPDRGGWYNPSLHSDEVELAKEILNKK